jgi:DNA-directed RNA polymerase subunit omega
MLYPTLSSLVKKTNNRYSLVLAVAKRARQLSDENEQVYTDYVNVCDKPVSIAVHEIAEGEIDIEN